MNSDDAPFGVKARTGKPRKSPPQGGRPDKLTDEVLQQMVAFLSVGATMGGACDYVGIAELTFRRWLKRGARDKAAGKKSRYARFHAAIKRAIATVEAGFAGTIAEAAKGRPARLGKGRGGKEVVLEPGMAPQWQAAAWWLERRKPQDYARRTYRIEDERVPQASVGAVVPYEVRIPAVDPLEPPRPEIARGDGSPSEDVKCKRRDPDGAG